MKLREKLTSIFFSSWKEKVKEKTKGEMEEKINKYFFSLLLYLSHVWITSWDGWDRMWMGH